MPGCTERCVLFSATENMWKFVTVTVGNAYAWHPGSFLPSGASDFSQQPCEQLRFSVLGFQMTNQRLHGRQDSEEAGLEPGSVCPPPKEEHRTGP